MSANEAGVVQSFRSQRSRPRRRSLRPAMPFPRVSLDAPRRRARGIPNLFPLRTKRPGLLARQPRAGVTNGKSEAGRDCRDDMQAPIDWCARRLIPDFHKGEIARQWDDRRPQLLALVRIETGDFLAAPGVVGHPERRLPE